MIDSFGADKSDRKVDNRFHYKYQKEKRDRQPGQFGSEKLIRTHFSDENQTNCKKKKMSDDSFYKQNVGEISRNIVNFCSSA